jgi:hypothetical protein
MKRKVRDVIFKTVNRYDISWRDLTAAANPISFAEFSDVNPAAESLSDWTEARGRNEAVFLGYIPKDEREWRREHIDLSFAVMLWEMILKDDERLNVIIKWDEETNRAFVRPFARIRLGCDFSSGDESYYAHYKLPPREIENPGRGTFDPKAAAVAYVREEICRKMTAFPPVIRFVTDENGDVRRNVEPTSLLSEMWYCFFFACLGDVKLRRCCVCGKWENMEGHRGTWSRHANCANYQRVKRSRQKKREEHGAQI